MRAGLLSAIAVLVGGLLGACGSTTTATTQTVTTRAREPNEAGKSAEQILTDAEAALGRVRSFHIQGSGIDLEGAPETVAGDFLLPGRMRVHYTEGDQSASLVLIGSTGYLRANTAFWTANSASAGVIALLAGRWIEVPATFPGFSQFASWSNPATIGHCLIGSHVGTISVVGTTTYAEVPVVVLRDAGDLPESTPGELYVSTTGAPLPARQLETGPARTGGAPDRACGGTSPLTPSTTKSSDVTMSRYNQPVQIAAPANAMLLNSLGSSQNAQVLSKAQAAAVSEQAIKQAFLQLPDARTDNLGDIEYLAPGEDPSDLSVGGACTVNVILASPEELAAYRGDSWVVTNSAGTAGAKISGTGQYETACLQEAANALKTVQ